MPIGIETVRYREYRERAVQLDGSQAMEQAFAELESALGRFVTETGAELLSKTVHYELDDKAYRIRCTVACVENIAREKPIDIS